MPNPMVPEPTRTVTVHLTREECDFCIGAMDALRMLAGNQSVGLAMTVTDALAATFRAAIAAYDATPETGQAVQS
jgi:hypothetical protein